MSLLTTFRKLAPFTADKLIDAANQVLASGGAVPMSKRTLRFYTAQGVVPRPMGSPKFARYGYEHLLTLLSARCLQDQGHKLHEISEEVVEIRRGQFARFEKIVQDWLDKQLVRESALAGYDETEEKSGPMEAPGSTPMRSLKLTPHSTLQVMGRLMDHAELTAVRAALDEVITKLS